MIPAEIDDLRLILSRVDLDLIDHRADPAVLQQRLKVRYAEVADADSADFSLIVQRFQGPPGFTVDLSPVRVLTGRCRPVDQVQIQVVGVEIL